MRTFIQFNLPRNCRSSDEMNITRDLCFDLSVRHVVYMVDDYGHTPLPNFMKYEINVRDIQVE